MLDRLWSPFASLESPTVISEVELNVRSGRLSPASFFLVLFCLGYWYIVKPHQEFVQEHLVFQLTVDILGLMAYHVLCWLFRRCKYLIAFSCKVFDNSPCIDCCFFLAIGGGCLLDMNQGFGIRDADAPPASQGKETNK